jgi:hypothetical protein
MTMPLPLRVTVEPERADAAPGDDLTFGVTVRNASDIVEHYGVEMLGLPDGTTVRTDPEVAKLRPAETTTLTVQVKLPVQPPAPAGVYVVGALVRSKYRGAVSRCVEVPIALKAVGQVTLRATPEVVTGGRAGRYTIEVANGGNTPVRLYLAATDPERRITAQFQPAWVDLPPGTAAQTLLTVEAPLPWNKEKQHQLSITANPDLPGAAPGTAVATFVQRPRFASKFAKMAGIAAGVIVLAAAIAVPALITKTMAKTGQPAEVTAQTAPAVVPPATTAATQPPPSSAAPATTSAAPPQTTAPTTDPPATTEPPPAARTVDLTKAKDGVIPSDEFRDQGFLVGADPGSVAVPGCEDARSAAVVTSTDGRRFLTSSTADDPAKCNTVPLLIDFLAGHPAGSIEVTPVLPDALTLHVFYVDLHQQDLASLTVTADQAKADGGIDAVELIPKTADPIAITAVTFTANG